MHEDGRTASGVCGNGSVPLSHSGERRYKNWYTHTHTHTHTHKAHAGSIEFNPFSNYWILARQLKAVKMV